MECTRRIRVIMNEIVSNILLFGMVDCINIRTKQAIYLNKALRLGEFSKAEAVFNHIF